MRIEESQHEPPGVPVVSRASKVDGLDAVAGDGAEQEVAERSGESARLESTTVPGSARYVHQYLSLVHGGGVILGDERPGLR